MDELQQLREENKQLKQENKELRERLAVAEAQIKQLVELLGQNSQNSNWPSSRDKSRKKRTSKSLRQKTGRKAGGQKGHKGHTLEFNPTPDVILFIFKLASRDGVSSPKVFTC
jgi:transposase